MKSNIKIDKKKIAKGIVRDEMDDSEMEFELQKYRLEHYSMYDMWCGANNIELILICVMLVL